MPKRKADWAVWAGFVLSITSTTAYLVMRFTHPDLTEIEAFLRWWWLAAAALTGIVVAIAAGHRGE